MRATVLAVVSVAVTSRTLKTHTVSRLLQNGIAAGIAYAV